VDEQTSFLDMLQRIRQGDGEAARKLVNQYEQEVRRIIRVRLTDPRLRRQIDSIDICQSVMGDFFIRVGLGQFDLETPEQLIKLLATMSRNRLLNHVAKQQAERRDVRRMEVMASNELSIAGHEPTPSQIVANRELLETFRVRLSPDELYLANQRAEGRGWKELSDELKEPSDTLPVASMEDFLSAVA
jgi:DNA-directed RNA polymerase specialized sigma24 family protein